MDNICIFKIISGFIYILHFFYIIQYCYDFMDNNISAFIKDCKLIFNISYIFLYNMYTYIYIYM